MKCIIKYKLSSKRIVYRYIRTTDISEPVFKLELIYNATYTKQTEYNNLEFYQHMYGAVIIFEVQDKLLRSMLEKSIPEEFV